LWAPDDTRAQPHVNGAYGVWPTGTPPTTDARPDRTSRQPRQPRPRPVMLPAILDGPDPARSGSQRFQPGNATETRTPLPPDRRVPTDPRKTADWRAIAGPRSPEVAWHDRCSGTRRVGAVGCGVEKLGPSVVPFQSHSVLFSIPISWHRLP